MNQAQAVVVVAAELRLFLRPGRRGGPVAVALDGTSSLGHVVESLGVPLTEAGRLLVNGEPAAPGYRPGNGDVVTVQAVRRPQQLTPARFVLDVHLGTLARRLRRHKQAEVLRIALRDLLGASVPDVTRDLSRLAARAFQAAVDFHYRRLCALHGPPSGRSPRGPSGFCVLGMGKLGGEELNFSSDADVIYVYDKDGHTAGGLPHFTFYARLAEEVGELAREVNHRFGPKQRKAEEPEGSVAMELADILFVVMCLANSQQIDLDDAFAQMMAKVTSRDAGRWTKKAR